MDLGKRREIERRVFRNGPMPASIVTLWDAVEADPEPLAALSLELLDSREVFDELRDVRAIGIEGQEGFDEMVERLAFVARYEDGDMLAIDPEIGPSQDPPIVLLDTEGQFGWIGLNAGEALYRRAEDFDLVEPVIEWMQFNEIPFQRPGDLGSTTGHLPDLNERAGGLRASRRPSPEPARPDDIMSWHHRPGPEVLKAVRTRLRLAPTEFPDEQWMACDGEGLVTSIWLRPGAGVQLDGVNFGDSRQTVTEAWGAPSKTFEAVTSGFLPSGPKSRYERGDSYILVEWHNERVEHLYIGTVGTP